MAVQFGVLDRIKKRFSDATQTYDAYARVQDEASERVFERIFQYAKMSGSQTALELGSGTGLLTRRLVQAGLFDRLTVTDISETMLKVNERLAGSHNGLVFDQMDVNLLEPVLSVDVIVANMCFQWTEDPETVLQRAAGALKKHGLVAFTVPVAGSFEEWKSAAGAADVPFTANALYAEEDWARFVEQADLSVSADVFTYRMKYPDIASFFHALKYIGAHTSLHHQPLSAAEMRRLVRAAPEPFNITYRIAVITGVKL